MPLVFANEFGGITDLQMGYEDGYLYALTSDDTIYRIGPSRIAEQHYTRRNVIAIGSKNTLIMPHNKTLAAQLFRDLKDFFPRAENLVT